MLAKLYLLPLAFAIFFISFDNVYLPPSTDSIWEILALASCNASWKSLSYVLNESDMAMANVVVVLLLCIIS